jgi:hypothetical protein
VSVKVLELPNETKNIELKNNIKNSFSFKNIRYNSDADYSNLFWLKESKTEGMYRISNPVLRILPEITTAFPVVFTLEIEGNTLEIVKNICYKFNNPDDGETYIPFTFLPEATTAILPEVLLFNGIDPKTVTVTVTAHKADIKGTVSLCYPSDWRVEPKEIPIAIASKNETQNVTFTVYPSKSITSTTLISLIQIEGQLLDRKLITLGYPHIPKQTLLLPSESKAVILDLKIKGKNIGYIMGAGDEIPDNLSQVGYQVTVLQPDAITLEKIQTFDAIILGIRAFNVVDELKYKNKILFDYVKNGGNLIVQYNTSNNLITNEIAPYKLKIANDRVTNENAAVTLLAPQHSVLHYPNKITEKDFTGWKQEQGLYYPNQWGTEFTPIISSSDPGETPKQGGLLIAKYGKGNYIYTGLSFFRELPEGVSGAYRLLANLIALE